MVILFHFGQVKADENGICGEGITWSFESVTGTLTISGNGPMYNSSKNKSTLTGDEYGSASWYKYRGNINNLVIEYGVTYIGNYSFYDCEAITSVTLPESITSIGEGAFEHCTGLTSVTFPKSLTEIGVTAFENCSHLASVYIPDGVTNLGDGAFHKCWNLANIRISTNLTDLHKYTFEETQWFRDQSDGVIYIDKWIYGWKGNMDENTRLKLSNGYKAIASGAFSSLTNLVHVTIPEGVTSIGEGAFFGCSNLASVTIPQSMRDIGENAFQLCRSLASINIPPSVRYIGKAAFWLCESLTSITIPEGVTTIFDDAFRNCYKLGSITIPNSVSYLGYNAFLGTAWLDNQPNGVVYIGKWVYSWKGSVPENTAVVVKNGCKHIGDRIFANKNFTSVSIPESLISIGRSAFYGSSITSMIIPRCLTSIGSSAFGFCKKLSSIYILAPSLDAYEDNVFSTGLKTRKIYVPASSVDTYKANWNNYTKEIFAIPAGNGDANNDKSVDMDDVKTMAGIICPTPTTDAYYIPSADMNADGVLDAADIVLLINKVK